MAGRVWLRVLVVSFALAAVLLLMVCGAKADELTREDFVKRAEPICKRNVEVNKRVLAGVWRKVKEGKFGLAGRQFLRAARALEGTMHQLDALPKPFQDKSRIAEWLGQITKQRDLLVRMSRALIAGQSNKASRLQAQLYSGAELTNAIAIPFEFRHCRFEPSKYA